MFHAMGAYHEHTRADRDQYIVVDIDNVEANRENNFEKIKDAEARLLDLPYDIASVMHYTKNVSIQGRKLSFSKGRGLEIL